MLNYNRVPGWMNDAELEVIRLLNYSVVETETVLEIGSFFGRSTVAWAEGKAARIYCLDPWIGCLRDWQWDVEKMGLQGDWQSIDLDAPIYTQFLANTSTYKNVCPVRMFSHEFNWFLGSPPSIIFIDGDHSPEGLYHDLDAAYSRWINYPKELDDHLSVSKKNGFNLPLIMGHDYNNPGLTHIKPVVDEFAAAYDFNVLWPDNTMMFLLEPKAFKPEFLRTAFIRQYLVYEELIT